VIYYIWAAIAGLSELQTSSVVFHVSTWAGFLVLLCGVARVTTTQVKGPYLVLVIE
jgi:hypothetical protein